ncbi:hypothetical protein JCM33774_88240 [Actinophytocola sp. KF-1]
MKAVLPQRKAVDTPLAGPDLDARQRRQDHNRIRGLRSPTLVQHGPLLVVVDQPATIAALPVGRPAQAGTGSPVCLVSAMRRIADTARALTHTLRPVDVGDETLAEPEVLVGFDDDLPARPSDCPTRIRGAGNPLPLRRPDRYRQSSRAPQGRPTG